MQKCLILLIFRPDGTEMDRSRGESQFPRCVAVVMIFAVIILFGRRSWNPVVAGLGDMPGVSL